MLSENRSVLSKDLAQSIKKRDKVLIQNIHALAVFCLLGVLISDNFPCFVEAITLLGNASFLFLPISF